MVSLSKYMVTAANEAKIHYLTDKNFLPVKVPNVAFQLAQSSVTFQQPVYLVQKAVRATWCLSWLCVRVGEVGRGGGCWVPPMEEAVVLEAATAEECLV